MDINAISGQQSSANQSATTLAKDFDNFLHLLTTQLQYQDPLAPMDSNQFTQQLVSFTGVEQSIATNKNLEQIVAQNRLLESSNAVDYLGKEITVQTDRAGLSEDGTAIWDYILGASTSTTKIEIKDQNGLVVDTLNGELTAGLHTLEWKAPSGTEPGVYSLNIEAKSGNDETIDHTVYSRGVVTSVEKLNGSVFLASNGILVEPSNILAVQAMKQTIPAEEGTE